MRFKFMAALAALILSTGAMALDRTNWTADLDAAKEQAKKDKKDVFVLFSGTDWQDESNVIAKELLDQKEFLDFAKKTYVLVLIDFPKTQGMTEAQKAIAAKSIALSNTYRNKSMPAIIIMKPNGEAFVYLQGYDGMTVHDFVTALGKDVPLAQMSYNQEVAAADKAKGLDRAKHLNEALGCVAKFGIFVTGAEFGYEKMIDEIIALDKDNEAHLKAEWSTFRQLKFIDDALRTRDWMTAHKLADKVIADFPGETELVQKMYAVKSFSYRNQGDEKKGMEYLKKIVELNPKNDIGIEAAQAIEMLENQGKAPLILDDQDEKK